MVESCGNISDDVMLRLKVKDISETNSDFNKLEDT
jgi:hypothetical protein